VAVRSIAAAALCVLALLVGVSLSVSEVAASQAKAATSSKKSKTRTTITLFPGETVGPGLLGSGVQWDPSFQPSQALWQLTERRVAFMSPGFIRVVQPASTYFKGYDSNHDPTYRWTSAPVAQLLKILAFAQAHRITVVFGDWTDPRIHGDARIPAEFIERLHDTYGFTDIRYYDPMNEPNYSSSCDFACWTNMMTALRTEFAQLGMSWIQLVGPSNGNSWDDTAAVKAADKKTGLDTDNPANDSWLTATVQTIPGEIGAYDSHRYATIWGIEHGVYGEQMVTRREEISNLDSPAKPFFEGEVGLTVRTTDPFAQDLRASQRRMLAALVDPSAPSLSTFTDSQPRIRQFNYGVWMGDMVIQATDAGLSGASAWDLDDALHSGGGYGSRNLKQWGFWNSLGGEDGYPASDLNLRPWYYAWSVLSRSFPAGAQALTVPSTNLAGVRLAAVRIPGRRGDALSFALVNENSKSRTVKLVVNHVRRRMKFALYDYVNKERPTDTSGFPVPTRVIRNLDPVRGYSVKLRSKGLVVLTSRDLSSTKLSEGEHTLVDNFRHTPRDSRGLRIDKSNPLVFDGYTSRATVTNKGAHYLIFRERRIKSFELKLFAKSGSPVSVYTSVGGHGWTAVPLASTSPAPALEGRGWYLEKLLPRGPLRRAALLKIKLPKRPVELAQVRIQHG
jgi:hypothetical protein